ncbi:multidrug efflux pump subunit AcrA (membrane-fusion protein) [Natronobacillus azotifigens]|uniref:HlyD family efflux transporter periplasmic adaptor subunit n=1 Tax=Natronobacillus azotifigens TaxID=472978 RepID=A0A9J6RGN4_9BACI|nr:HlyD family efflux transporter periplasmic adaptor subunit [Natronobacillus azotifigens]MCZ0704564.1 HlyD family efflux transporter periplasmic adaptor subunit [Natronobacillus azotifigens]
MKLFTRQELKDARVFFDKQPPRYMTVFILFTIGVLVLSLIGAQVVKRPYIVKAQGTVTVEGTSYLAARTHGVVTELHVNSGQYVEKGEPILSISTGNEGIQASVVDAQIAELEETLMVMDRYEEAIATKTNTLNREGQELEYYGKMAYYLDTLNQEEFETTKLENDIQEKQQALDQFVKENSEAKKNLERVITKLNDKETEQKSISNSLVEKEEKHEVLFQELTALEEKAMESEEETLFEALADKQKELDRLSESMEQTQQKLESDDAYIELMEKKAEYEAAIESNDMEIKGIEDELKHLNEEKETPYSQAEQTRLQLLSELGEKRNQVYHQLVELRANQGAANQQDEIHQVVASESGVVHYLQPLSQGISIQQNQVIGEIAMEDNNFYIDSYINAQDRSRVGEGQSVKVQVLGVNNYRFGTLEGTLTFIEPGTIQNETQEGVVSFYRATVQLDTTKLQSKSDEVIEIVRSMPVEARIVYQEESYLEWLLNLLNLISS